LATQPPDCVKTTVNLPKFKYFLYTLLFPQLNVVIAVNRFEFIAIDSHDSIGEYIHLTANFPEVCNRFEI
jgi:hypothetical protein